MSTIYLADQKSFDKKIGNSLGAFERKAHVFPPGVCPINVHLALLETSIAQTCGKCVPCRDALPQAAGLIRKILGGAGTEETYNELVTLVDMINSSADCAIGYQAAFQLREALETFKDEYMSHIHEGKCTEDIGQQVPCINLCPAHVDIPAYIALVANEDYAGAINMIRKDNPFPTACAMVCEHPCEERCRRTIIDAPLNIRGIKKYAVDMLPADKVATPKAGDATGKTIGIIGGGPAGLTCAYFLAIMGHKVEVYEKHDKLGGMLRYGIPNYRFPKDRLDEDTRAILGAGDIKVIYNTEVGKDIPVKEVFDKYDAMFVAIGAQAGKGLAMEGSDSKGVSSAVAFLDDIGNGNIPDLTGKHVVVIGGGNVAMDAARSAVRCKAEQVNIVYRRRQQDMTALDSEIEAAISEGCQLITLQAPDKILSSDGNCKALVTIPQMIGAVKNGRAAVLDADRPPMEIRADVVLIAVGQDIVSAPFEEFGMPAERHVFKAGLDTAVAEMPGVFVGGDCATSPATAIRAVAAGKVAAHNIDEYLGYHHTLNCDVEVPPAKENNRMAVGRVNIGERPAVFRVNDFDHVEELLTHAEAMQEAGRCLRCDHFGCGCLEGGRD